MEKYAGLSQKNSKIIVPKIVLQKTLAELAQEKFDRKTKPQGSLGDLEKIAVRLATLQNTLSPSVSRKRILVFAGSHGVAKRGVSAYPEEVTAQMVLNFLRGGAAINVLARHGGIDLRIINAGVNGDLSNAQALNFRNEPVRKGTRDFTTEPAMTKEELDAALALGKSEVERAKQEGYELLGIGEMGIGNTTSAAALCAALLALPPQKVCGRGTGVDDEGLRRKIAAVCTALDRHGSTCKTALEWLAAVGGYEIAAMTGAIFAASQYRLPMVIDGFIATAAALVAVKANPDVSDVCFFGHLSAEGAHQDVLQHLKAEPILALNMRLGEGTGAALAMHILDGAAKLLCEMATFESAGVSEKL